MVYLDLIVFNIVQPLVHVCETVMIEASQSIILDGRGQFVKMLSNV